MGDFSKNVCLEIVAESSASNGEDDEDAKDTKDIEDKYQWHKTRRCRTIR